MLVHCLEHLGGNFFYFGIDAAQRQTFPAQGRVWIAYDLHGEQLLLGRWNRPPRCRTLISPRVGSFPLLIVAAARGAASRRTHSAAVATGSERAFTVFEWKCKWGKREQKKNSESAKKNF
jgi:hypothetical protein